MNKLQGLISSVCAVALAPLAFPTVASAQSAVDALTDDDAIIVTARKRGDENVQDVPLAVTAFGADQLEALNFQDLQSLSYTMPNVQLEDVGTVPGYANFSIRGLGINSSIPSIDPAVGVFVDGIYVGIPAGVVVDNFDLAGVEVLRGPQGVLFGRNVTGGAVLLRTSAPSFDFEARARVGVETGLRGYGDFAVTGPIFAGAAAKLAVYHSSDQGYFETADGGNLGENHTTIFRPAITFAPTDNFDLTLRLEHGVMVGDGPVSQNHALLENDRRGDNFTTNEQGYQDDSWDQAILETNWRVGFGDGTITNILGYREYDSRTLADIDGYNGPFAIGFHGAATIEQDQISNELRYAGTFGNVDVTAGLYYFQQDLFYLEYRNLANGIRQGLGGGIGDFSSAGAFVATDWHVTPEFTLNFGVRYTEEEKDARILVMDALNPNAATLYAAQSLTPNYVSDASWNDTSPRVGFQWTPSEDTQIYGYWAQGFRSGGYNFRQTVPITADVNPGPFDPEEQSAFELGIKQDFADGRGRINLALFHSEISDMQREINQPSINFGVNQQILNAGDATIQGAEIEARWRFTDNLLVSIQGGYTNGEYDAVFVDLNGDGLVGNDADLSLNIPRLAKWTYGMTAVHDLDIGDLGTLATRVSYSHRDRNYYTDDNRGYFDPVDLWDVNFTFTPQDGPWSISVYGENLTDVSTYGGDTVLTDTGLALLIFGGDGPGGRPLPTFSPLNRGRVIGASLRYAY